MLRRSVLTEVPVGQGAKASACEERLVDGYVEACDAAMDLSAIYLNPEAGAILRDYIREMNVAHAKMLRRLTGVDLDAICREVLN